MPARPRVPSAPGGRRRAARRPRPVPSCSRCPPSSAARSPTSPGSSARSGCGWTDEPTSAATRCHPRRRSTTELRVTVKRTPDGVVSNWMNDHVAPGDVLEATRPAGVFRLGDGTGDVVALSAGSGITPVLSLLKTALATTPRRVRLLYANRDEDAVIFRAELDALQDRPRRAVHRAPPPRRRTRVLTSRPPSRRSPKTAGDAEFYVCGPGTVHGRGGGHLARHGCRARSDPHRALHPRRVGARGGGGRRPARGPRW